MGYYPTIPASNPAIFTNGLLKLLASYPPETIEQAANPVSGIPACVPFLNLAEIKTNLDRWHGEHLGRLKLQQHGKRLEPPSPRPPSAEAKARVQAIADDVRQRLGSAIPRMRDAEREQRWREAEARLSQRAGEAGQS